MKGNQRTNVIKLCGGIPVVCRVQSCITSSIVHLYSYLAVTLRYNAHILREEFMISVPLRFFTALCSAKVKRLGAICTTAAACAISWAIVAPQPTKGAISNFLHGGSAPILCCTCCNKQQPACPSQTGCNTGNHYDSASDAGEGGTNWLIQSGTPCGLPANGCEQNADQPNPRSNCPPPS